ncbi:caspase-14-like [Pelodiscus sinensis]|uniref:caspase-14-like n=1 Tax=Pelodiscus sinensis TaxID=13735 RepID=UPI003F6ADAE1
MERQILGILKELDAKELREFKFHLRKRENDPHCPSKADLDGVQEYPALAELLVQRYPRTATEVLSETLACIPRNDLVDRIRPGKAADAVRTGHKQTTHQTSDTSFKERTEQSDQGKLDKYDMSKKRVAFMMCVKKGRPGAEKDIERMNKWLCKYQFEEPFQPCIDPDEKEILLALKKFRDKINQSKDEVSCCLITLMSHGRNGYIQGNDTKEVLLDDIFALFNNMQCPKLQEKPKIFIIQACRGGKKDSGVEKTDDEPEEVDDTSHFRLPTASDYFIVYSTQKDYVSLRNTEKGSRIIEAMDEVLSKDGTEWHIWDLFTKINGNLVGKTFEHNNSSVKQTLVMESTLTKALYLAP